jgi:ubiquinone/menaquinone biosynthesis C-methylase UbiE
LWEVARKECLAAGNPGNFTVWSSRYALEVRQRLGFVQAGPPETKNDVMAVPMKYEQPSSQRRNAMSTSYFDQSAATWDNEPRRIALMKAVGEAILREAQPSKDTDVLDYGCGTGLVSLFLLPHVRSVTGADNSPGMLEVLNKKITEGGIGNMKVVRLNLEEDRLPEERYHLIVTSMTMHHVADTARVLRAFHGLLHAEGKLCVADLDIEPGVFHPPEAAGSVHHHGFDRESLKGQLRAADFTKMHDVTAHTVYKPIEGTGERAFPVFLITAAW